MIKAGIVGATGYTGAELIRLLAVHPEAQLVAVTSRSDEGNAVADMYPHLRGVVNLNFVAPEVANLADCDVVFFAASRCGTEPGARDPGRRYSRH